MDARRVNPAMSSPGVIEKLRESDETKPTLSEWHRCPTMHTCLHAANKAGKDWDAMEGRMIKRSQ
jgi:hypothetical protein